MSDEITLRFAGCSHVLSLPPLDNLATITRGSCVIRNYRASCAQHVSLVRREPLHGTKTTGDVISSRKVVACHDRHPRYKTS